MNKQERDALIMSYARFVHMKVRKHGKTGKSDFYWHLYQEGMIAVCQVVDSYIQNDLYSLTRAVSLAVSSRICHAIRVADYLIPIKKSSDKSEPTVRELRKLMRHKDVTYKDLVELSNKSGADLEILKAANAAMTFQFIYDLERVDVNTTPEHKTLEDREVLYKIIKRALVKLSPKERETIVYFLKGLNMAELANKRGVYMQASQITFRNAIKKLKAAAEEQNIKSSDAI